MEIREHKKILLLIILDILNKYTDEDHRLSQAEIADKVKSEYGMSVERKAVKRNLMQLVEWGYNVKYSSVTKILTNKYGEEEPSAILSDFYLEPTFSKSDIDMMIDGVLSSNNIPATKSKQLTKKLAGLSNKYYKAPVKDVTNALKIRAAKEQLYSNFRIIDEAIHNNEKVDFGYTEIDIDKKYHVILDDEGYIESHTVSPYKICAYQDNYYLICCEDSDDSLTTYRIDKIRELEIIDDSIRPLADIVTTDGEQIDINIYIKRNIYGIAGRGDSVVFRAGKHLLEDITETFGNKVTISDESDDQVTVSLDIPYEAVEKFAMQHPRDIQVLKPLLLVERIKDNIKSMAESYGIMK